MAPIQFDKNLRKIDGFLGTHWTSLTRFLHYVAYIMCILRIPTGYYVNLKSFSLEKCKQYIWITKCMCRKHFQQVCVCRFLALWMNVLQSQLKCIEGSCVESFQREPVPPAFLLNLFAERKDLPKAKQWEIAKMPCLTLDNT